MGLLDNFNKFLEKAPYDDGRSSPDYPWIHGIGGLLGDRKIVHANPDKPDEAYHEKIHHDGTFEHKEANGLLSRISKEVREYVSGGHSHNSDSHKADHTQGSKNTDAKGDMGTASGGDHFKGHGGKEIGGSSEGGHNHTDGDDFRTSKGNVVSSHEGDMHTNHDGDHVSTVNGTNYHTTVGDHALNVQGGQLDVQVNSGNTRIYSAKSILIQSGTEITLRVGNSTLYINSSAMSIDIPGVIGIGANSNIGVFSNTNIGLFANTSGSGYVKIVGPTVTINPPGG